MTSPDTGSGRDLTQSRFLPPVTTIFLCSDCVVTGAANCVEPIDIRKAAREGLGVYLALKIGLVQR